MGTREVYEEKLRSGNLQYDPTINPGLGSARCPRCLSIVDPGSRGGEWKITSVLHDFTGVAGSGLGALLIGAHGFNRWVPYVEKRVKGPKWVQVAVGIPPVLLFAGAGAAFGAYVVPKFAQFTVSSYYAAYSASYYAISQVTRRIEKLNSSQSSHEESRFTSASLPATHKHKLSVTEPNFHQSSICTLKCRAQNRPQESPTAQALTSGSVYSIKFETLQACKLGISWYPDFEYNAEGGTGTATGVKKGVGESSDEELLVSFDVKSLYIPALTGSTTRFLGLPLPPFLKIEIAPEVLEGTINRGSGKVELDFRARFWFSIGSLYRAPPLVVETTLTSEESSGSARRGKGDRLGEDGRCKLVGVAIVDPVNDLLMDSFLGLPTECIADLNARISIN